MADHLSHNQKGAGSSPAPATNNELFFERDEPMDLQPPGGLCIYIIVIAIGLLVLIAVWIFV